MLLLEACPGILGTSRAAQLSESANENGSSRRLYSLLFVYQPTTRRRLAKSQSPFRRQRDFLSTAPTPLQKSLVQAGVGHHHERIDEQSASAHRKANRQVGSYGNPKTGMRRTGLRILGRRESVPGEPQLVMSLAEIRSILRISATYSRTVALRMEADGGAFRGIVSFELSHLGPHFGQRMVRSIGMLEVFHSLLHPDSSQYSITGQSVSSSKVN